MNGARRLIMAGQRRRLLSYLGIVVAVVIAYTLLYDWGMTAFEGRPRDLLYSFGIVVETFTTTGYGQDAPWHSTQMQALMILMQLTGVSVIFLTLPLFVAPWVERRFSTTVPTSIDLADHVVLCGLSPRGHVLIEELESWERDYVVVEPDRDRAASLREQGVTAIRGDPESEEALERAGLAAADALVADAEDERNPSIVLSAREVAADVRIVAFAEDPDMADYLEYAGADEVFSPHQLLGERLANEVTTAVSTELGDTVEIGSDFELVELPVQSGCAIAGSRLADSGIRERTGVNVLGLWQRGEFTPSPDPDTTLDQETILLVAGSESQLASLKRLTLSEERRRARGTVIIAGYGQVGSAVSGALSRSEMRSVVVDADDRSGVDVVGDATQEAVLEKAGIADANSLVLALPDDTATMLATLVAREIDESIRIVARAEEAESVGKVYRAGADYVLALATVSGRMTASTLLDEEVIAPESQVEIVRTEAPAFVGQTLAGADIRSETGCTVIAVERNGDVETDLDPDFAIEDGDTLIVAGTDDAINRFNSIAQ